MPSGDNAPVAAEEGLDHAVEAMQAGDEAAFRLVYRHVQPPLLRYLTVLVGPTDAEDVASEAWTQAFRDLDRFSGDADGFRGWITTIGRNRALDHLRHHRRRPVSEEPVDELVDLPDDADVEADTLGRVNSEAVVRLISALPRDQAEAIMLRTVLGFDAPTAARILGKRPGAVRAAAHRGLKQLAKKIVDEP
ncbi:sigma-70 family RNA polymerase sigma factor [Nocardioides ganghwensis]|jgi:RNA polymerase sigma-70 factor (ECF subfamily)|uniref:Sigma-70 family RNA polymerase sigma factor n=1 Tax=Nocardioides ganghwensis TaxID=252230 RepID=A0A4Q2SHR0_9ACTN|nr:sigma-70 family RNA polymerase sigma factor [Nocardioides ganghwensis]RYC05055.1 sigma-70 family RNA polymerase sigma factor [Nocardioides ganghwensis]